jgi:hypothetical protein
MALAYSAKRATDIRSEFDLRTSPTHRTGPVTGNGAVRPRQQPAKTGRKTLASTGKISMLRPETASLASGHHVRIGPGPER